MLRIRITKPMGYFLYKWLVHFGIDIWVTIKPYSPEADERHPVFHPSLISLCVTDQEHMAHIDASSKNHFICMHPDVFAEFDQYGDMVGDLEPWRIPHPVFAIKNIQYNK